MDKYKELLAQFIQLKSISTDKSFKPEVEACAKWLADLLKENRFEVEVVEGFGNPIVIGSYVADPTAQTVLIYGHYDVQPAEVSDGWTAEPFAVDEREGRLYARGIVDNKGQILIHIFSVLQLIESGELKYNVKFMIEGNEETGSPDLPKFLDAHKDLLACDFTIISDGELKGEYPTVAVGFRGGFNSTLSVRSSTTDLHSGIYGGAVPSSSDVLTKFLAKLTDQNGMITIPGFYDSVDLISAETLQRNKETPFDLETYLKITGVKKMTTENDYDFYTQTGLRPAVVITGISSGYTGDGYRNGVPAISKAKINFRLVKNQNPEEMAQLFREYVEKNLPITVTHELEITDPYEGTKLDPNNSFIKRAEPILEQIYSNKVIFEYSGGGLPIVTLFDELLGVPQLIVNLANEDCAMHAPDENFRIDLIEKGIEFSKTYLSSN